MPVRSLPRAAVATGLVVGIVAVSTSAILSRFAMGEVPGVTTAPPGAAPALAVAFWRTALGAGALAPWAAARQRRAERHGHRSRLGAATHRRLAASGVLLGLHFALFQGALALTTVASAVTLVTMSPLFVALGARWFLREPADRQTWLGMALTILGALAIGVGDATAIDLGHRALVGDAMAFGGALAIAGYLLLGRRARRDVPALTYSTVVYGWAAITLLPLCLATGTTLGGFDATTWVAIAAIVVGPQLLGHTVFNTLLSTVSATVVAIAVLAEPVGAGILAWLLLDELPAPAFAIGAPLVLAGIVIATLRRRGVPGAPPA